jgi:hypothetical protein
VANYQQPDFRNPVTPGVSMQIEAIRNVLQTTAADPAVAYVQPGVVAPQLAAGQLGGSKSGMLGNSKRTNADGSITNL